MQLHIILDFYSKEINTYFDESADSEENQAIYDACMSLSDLASGHRNELNFVYPGVDRIMYAPPLDYIRSQIQRLVDDTSGLISEEHKTSLKTVIKYLNKTIRQ